MQAETSVDLHEKCPLLLSECNHMVTRSV